MSERKSMSFDKKNLTAEFSYRPARERVYEANPMFSSRFATERINNEGKMALTLAEEFDYEEDRPEIQENIKKIGDELRNIIFQEGAMVPLLATRKGLIKD